MERARSRIVAGTAALIGAVFVTWMLWPRPDARASRPVPGDNGRSTVEVLNATQVTGLARDMTRRLRAAGIDVVYFGTAVRKLDSTLIVIRRGDSSHAHRVREVLGLGTVIVDLDPRLLLDVSVLLGLDLAGGRDGSS